jgi:hypothetical protein
MRQLFEKDSCRIPKLIITAPKGDDQLIAGGERFLRTSGKAK